MHRYVAPLHGIEIPEAKHLNKCEEILLIGNFSGYSVSHGPGSFLPSLVSV